MAIEERVVNLEEALARFIEQSNAILAANREDLAASRQDLAANREHIAAIHAEVAEIRASNARTDRQLLQMQQQAEKDREQAEKDRQQIEKDRQQAERDRKEFNKRLAEISDSMGTLIEDMVAPCGFKLAQAIFADQEAQTSGIRLKARHPANPGEMMELDLLAVGPTKALVVEVKRRIDAGKAEEYRRKLQRLPEFFPALAGKTVCAAVASVYLEPSVIAFLNRQKLYGIAMGEEVMEVVNLGQF
jgi:TolA-binding protein